MYTRQLQKTISEHLFKKKVIILYGPRQVGKTTLVKNILREYNGKSLYIQCDIVSQREPLSESNPAQLKSYFGDATLIVIDEAQLVENIGVVTPVRPNHPIN